MRVSLGWGLGLSVPVSPRSRVPGPASPSAPTEQLPRFCVSAHPLFRPSPRPGPVATPCLPRLSGVLSQF